MKHGSTFIVLDLVSFFLITIELYGEERLAKLSQKMRSVGDCLQGPIIERLGGAIVGGCALTFLIFGYVFAFTHVVYAELHWHLSTLELVLWDIMTVSIGAVMILGPIVVQVIATWLIFAICSRSVRSTFVNIV